MTAPTVGTARFPSPRTVSRAEYLTDRDKLAARMAAALLRDRHADEYRELVDAMLVIIDREVAS